MIHFVAVKEFLIHKDRTFQLSPRVTLVVGRNGSGKTAFVQSIIWAIWGKSFRALTEHSNVTARTSVGDIWRRVTSTELVDYPGVRSSNKTKAAAYLTAQFGDYYVWSRTLHITGQNVRHFTGATPSGKWEHLVRVLDAPIFDRALDLLKEQERAVQVELGRLTDVKIAIDHAIDTYSRHAHAHYSSLNIVKGASPSAANASEQLKRTEERLYSLGRTIQDLKSQIGQLDTEQASLFLSDQLAQVEKDLKELPPDSCFVCGQPVVTATRTGLLEQEAALREKLAAYRRSREGLRERLNAANAKYVEELGLQQLYTNQLQQESMSLELFHSMEQQYVWTLTEGAKQLLEATKLLKQVDDATRQKEDILLAAAVIKKAKHRYLTERVTDITALTNRYLAIIGATHRVDIAFTNNKLDVLVDGEGAASYDACSSGEQRRIDICLLLAMAQVASAYGNLTKETPMIIDEALDTLDTEGVEALLLLACEIGKTRQVLLVSHATPPLPQDTNIQTLRM